MSKLLIAASDADIEHICNSQAWKDRPASMDVSFFCLQDATVPYDISQWPHVVAIGFLGVALVAKAFGDKFPRRIYLSVFREVTEALTNIAGWYGIQSQSEKHEVN
jgi:hypothetical protein